MFIIHARIVLNRKLGTCVNTLTKQSAPSMPLLDHKHVLSFDERDHIIRE